MREAIELAALSRQELVKLIRQQEKQVDAYTELSELQDKLLICYRVGKNPGSILDKLAVARARIEKLKAVIADEDNRPGPSGSSSQNDTAQQVREQTGEALP